MQNHLWKQDSRKVHLVILYFLAAIAAYLKDLQSGIQMIALEIYKIEVKHVLTLTKTCKAKIADKNKTDHF